MKVSIWAGAVIVAVLGAAMAFRGESTGARKPPSPAETDLASPAAPPVEASPRPAPSRPPSSAAAVEPRGNDDTSTVEPSSDEELTARLRIEAEEDPEVAIGMADEGERRFPDGPHAAERSYLKMRALVHLGDIVAAREAAERFFERHPRSEFGRFVFRLTGMRPRPGPWE